MEIEEHQNPQQPVLRTEGNALKAEKKAIVGKETERNSEKSRKVAWTSEREQRWSPGQISGAWDPWEKGCERHHNTSEHPPGEKEEQSGKRWGMYHLLEESSWTGKGERGERDCLQIGKSIGIEKEGIIREGKNQQQKSWQIKRKDKLQMDMTSHRQERTQKGSYRRLAYNSESYLWSPVLQYITDRASHISTAALHPAVLEYGCVSWRAAWQQELISTRMCMAFCSMEEICHQTQCGIFKSFPEGHISICWQIQPRWAEAGWRLFHWRKALHRLGMDLDMACLSY